MFFQALIHEFALVYNTLGVFLAGSRFGVIFRLREMLSSFLFSKQRQRDAPLMDDSKMRRWRKQQETKTLT